MEKLPNHESRTVGGVYSDSVGVFVTEGKKEALVTAGKCKANDGLVGNCCIHNTQLTTTVPIQKIFGSGGVGIQNVVQLLYLAYCLQTSIGHRVIWEL